MYISTNITENLSYPAPQSNYSDGLVYISDEFIDIFYPKDKKAAGFVKIEHDGEKVTSCVWNEEAYQSWLSKQPDPVVALKEKKENEISNLCNKAITDGMDVTTSKGEEHFSLQETDQINLTTAYNAILSGSKSYPYHADGQLCRMFTAEEITAISNASIQHKLYHTTLCNHLLTWVRRSETEEEINNITYSAENLPKDLAENMSQVMAAAQNV